MQVSKLKGLLFEIRNLKKKVASYTQSNEYVYTNRYGVWVKEYNDLLNKYNVLAELKINLMTYDQWDLSSTQKTVKNSTIDVFLNTIDSLADKLEDDIEEDRQNNMEKNSPAHQMRRCFKVDLDNCPVNPPYDKNKIFIAMPFDDAYLDSYNYGIVLALNALGFRHYKANNEITNKDIMCKVCCEIQSCGIAVINISGLNPNVMLELGLAYGLGKSVIIIKDKSTKTTTDLGSIEYIEYYHAQDLMNKLVDALSKLTENKFQSIN